MPRSAAAKKRRQEKRKRASEEAESESSGDAEEEEEEEDAVSEDVEETKQEPVKEAEATAPHPKEPEEEDKEEDTEEDKEARKEDPGPRKISPWLEKFIKKDRSQIVVEEYELPPLNDYIVADFAKRCLEEGGAPVAAEAEAPKSPVEAEVPEAPPPPSPEVEKKRAEAKAARRKALDPKSDMRVVFVQNLSYECDEDALKKECEAFGRVTRMTMPPARDGQRVGRRAGYALVTFSEEDEARKCVEGLNDRVFMSRKLRAKLERLKPDAKNNQTRAPERYFDDETSGPAKRVKKKNPCVLCGFEGHLMDACPRSLCPRCLESGHAERDCRSRDQVALCTNCGRWGHGWQWCSETDGPDRLARHARCIACGLSGHLDCSGRKPPPTSDVFCSCCGARGHTQPSCPSALPRQRGVGRRRASEPGDSSRDRDNDRRPSSSGSDHRRSGPPPGGGPSTKRRASDGDSYRRDSFDPSRTTKRSRWN